MLIKKSFISCSSSEIRFSTANRFKHSAQSNGLQAGRWRSCGVPRSKACGLFLGMISCLFAVTISGCGSSYTVTGATGIGPFQTSTNTVDFGDVPVGQTAESSLTLVNQGSTPISVSSLKISGNEFAIANGASLPITVAANSTYSLDVQFKPKASGSSTGQLTVSSSSQKSPSLKVKLHGNGSTAHSASLTLSSLSCGQSSFAGSGSDACTVTLSAAAGSGGLTVSLSSNDGAVTVPASATVPAGSTSAGFTATVAAVSVSKSVTIAASVGGVTKSFTLQLNAATQATQATLSSLSCASASITGLGSDACTVTLSAAAPSGGATVALSSSSTAVAVPGSVTVPAGATTAQFSATVSAVNAAQTVTLTASLGGVSQSFSLTLNATTSVLTVNASNIAFGDVTLKSTATQSIVLTSSGTASVTVNSATVTGAGFTLSGLAFPLTLNPGQSATLNVTFAPTVTGQVSGQVTISSNSSSNPTATVSLSGSGISVLYQVSLTWSAPQSSADPVTGYNIYRATGNSSYQVINQSMNTSTTFTDLTVQSGNSYSYYVESVDAAGNQSTPSNTYTVNVP